jgi:hypothetical protein
VHLGRTRCEITENADGGSVANAGCARTTSATRKYATSPPRRGGGGGDGGDGGAADDGGVRHASNGDGGDGGVQRVGEGLSRRGSCSAVCGTRHARPRGLEIRHHTHFLLMRKRNAQHPSLDHTATPHAFLLSSFGRRGGEHPPTAVQYAAPF